MTAGLCGAAELAPRALWAGVWVPVESPQGAAQCLSETGLVSPLTCSPLFFLTVKFEIFVDSHADVRTNIERCPVFRPGNISHNYSALLPGSGN